MFAHGIYLVNRRAAGNQQPVERLKILQRYCGQRRLLEWLFDQRRATAGEQKQDQRAFVASREPVEDGAAGGKTPRVRHRVAGNEGLETRKRAPRRRGPRKNPLHPEIGRQHVEQALGHCLGRLAVDDGADAFELRQIYEQVTAADARARALELAPQCSRDVNGGERFAEDSLGDFFEFGHWSSGSF